MKIASAVLVLTVSGLGACGMDGGLAESLDSIEQATLIDPGLPTGFARVTDAGDTLAEFNSSGGTISVSHGSVGNYTVTFAGLGVILNNSHALGGNVQITAEGDNDVRCRPLNWGGWPDLVASVECNAPDGILADSAFAIQYFRYVMPAPNPYQAWAAYTRVQPNGMVNTLFDYNESGKHNTVMKTGTGAYTVFITQAATSNVSVMVSPVGGAPAGNVCSIKSWSKGVAYIRCADRNGNTVDSEFSFSYSWRGPTVVQQSAHTWFNGTSTHASYTWALPRTQCSSPVSVYGDSMGELATISVEGDLGSWDDTSFVRASFVSKYGLPGYCKVESLVSIEGASSISFTTVNCYSATGIRLTNVGQFTFTQVANEGWGPC